MKVILASPRGFCAGVVMAVDALERARALYGTPPYAYHETVHNPAVAELAQATLSVDETRDIIAALRGKFPSIAAPDKDNICCATQNRQEAVHEIAEEADVVLVLGSKNSSNSLRLVEIAESLGKR